MRYACRALRGLPVLGDAFGSEGLISVSLEHMAIASPFEGLQLSQELVCEFFAVFSRFEFALKDSGFIRAHKGHAEPAWRDFSASIAATFSVTARSPLDSAIAFLLGEPPMVQVSRCDWEHKRLHGNTDTERALDAVIRVRNNLFHGGKYTPHSPPGRDEALVRASLAVLYACLEQDESLRNTYEQNFF
ncbi:hypothetical protein [Immundisolibacter cernigliae]|uniref:hypothetical protein n=1 Tax=Immundisolibacter cernigliae TaxID=1810504 RepID=UPI0011AB6F3E|nr:hypothetical protein [Immundisolibacter cernigliae]